jgi:FKBP-type peptidyl-prolyl cis-trans isomerase
METTQNNKKITYIIILIAVLLLGYIIYSVMQNNKNKNMETNATTTDQALGQLRVAEAGDVIVINYSGKLADGTEFDSSYKRGQPFVFQVGVGQVIKGWDEGLIGAKKGDKKTLTITPDKGYGDKDVKGQDGKVIIPKNSTLIFDVEVVEVISKADAERMMAEQQAAQAAATGTSTAR